MMIRLQRFNTYLWLAALAVALLGCQSPEKKAAKKAAATFRVHIEVPRDNTGHSVEILFPRDHPQSLMVGRTWFISEANVKEAKVVEVFGTFSLEVRLNRPGRWLLEQYTSANRRKHLAIFSEFVPPGDSKRGDARWLAAPLIQTPIVDGVLTFAPDATREEAEMIAQGLNNAADKNKSENPAFD